MPVMSNQTRNISDLNKSTEWEKTCFGMVQGLSIKETQKDGTSTGRSRHDTRFQFDQHMQKILLFY